MPICQNVTVVTSTTKLMVTLFLGNFEFEHRLARPDARALPLPVRQLADELACAWLAIAEEGDLVWMPAGVEADCFEFACRCGLPRLRAVAQASDAPPGTNVCPWGWTGETRDWAKANGWKCDAPDAGVVRRVNSRLFSSELEREFAVGLPSATVIRSHDDLLETLRQLSPRVERWAIKAEFGMSGREKILSRGTEPNDLVHNWLGKRLAQDGAAVFEPWVDRVEEAGLQFTLPRSGPPTFEGVTPMWVDATGTYRGSRITCDPATKRRWSPAIETGLRAAERVQDLGYFGPLGIDALRYRDDRGNVRLRPLMDINARYTMGRLSLGFRRLLRPGEVASWLHLNQKAVESAGQNVDWDHWLAAKMPDGARFVRTSPLRVAGRAVEHMTCVVIAESEATLSETETRLFSA